MSRHARLVTLLLLLCANAAFLASSTAQEGKPDVRPAPVPGELKEVVFGARKQKHVDFTIDDARFRGIATHGNTAFLIWNSNPASPLELARSREAVARWLPRISKALGLHDFGLRFLRVADWRGTEVWEYEYVRKGTRLLDCKLRIYWKGNRFLGLFNQFPAPITGIDEIPDEDQGGAEKVYFAERSSAAGQEGQRYRLVIATLRRKDTATSLQTEVITKRGVAYTLFEQKEEMPAQAAAGTFTEHSVPVGTFPDQIWADSTGIIWFSQPPNNYLTAFDPSTERFVQYTTTGGRGPDGLWVDDHDRAWTGLYYSGHLGMLDIATKKFTAISAPYSPASMAIPSPGPGQTVWITDHANNRISQYDPSAARWIASHVLPVFKMWVTAGTLDPVRETVYFTGYMSNSLIVLEPGKAIQSIPVPNLSGPAFLAYHHDKVYFSLWSTNRLGVYDVVKKSFTAYAFRSGEMGGPMSITPNGEPVIGTRSQGYIVVFDPMKKVFAHYKIPTSIGLKDGLTVAPDGAIWFTGTGSKKIARLELK